MKFYEPNPIYDEKEKLLLTKLTDDYVKFTSPNKFEKQLNTLAKHALDIVPNQIKQSLENCGDYINEKELYQNVMKTLAEGFNTIEKLTTNATVSEKKVINDIQKKYPFIDSIDKITYARSYDIQKIVNSKTTANYIQALVEGAATGAPGIIGLPFNIVLSTFLFYRVVQNIAMHYGYDVKGDPKELEFAGEVFLTAFTHGAAVDVNSAGAIIGKIMLQSELTALKHNVSKLTLRQLAEQGGAQLIYVQIRALAHKTAGDALKMAGGKSLEKSMFEKLLKFIGQNLPKSAVKKTVPVLSGIIGALFDTSYMGKVIKGANLIYHKRFLLEKETRIKIESDCHQDFTDVDFEEYLESSPSS